MAEHPIEVEVIHVGTDRVERRRVVVSRGSTVIQAIEASAIMECLPAGAVDPTRLGIFARKVAAEQVVCDGDRIEIYRPLELDPMEARRRRSR